jgi:hypothetical protein
MLDKFWREKGAERIMRSIEEGVKNKVIPVTGRGGL